MTELVTFIFHRQDISVQFSLLLMPQEDCASHCGLCWMTLYIQSTLVISNSKELSEILQYIRTSTYQICRIEEKIIRTTTFNKYICNWTLEVGDILKILWKRGEIAP